MLAAHKGRIVSSRVKKNHSSPRSNFSSIPIFSAVLWTICHCHCHCHCHCCLPVYQPYAQGVPYHRPVPEVGVHHALHRVPSHVGRGQRQEP